MFVSHDQYFLSKIATELVAVAHGAVRIFRDLEEAKQFTYKVSLSGLFPTWSSHHKGRSHGDSFVVISLSPFLVATHASPQNCL